MQPLSVAMQPDASDATPVGGDASDATPVGGDASDATPDGGDASDATPVGGDASDATPDGGDETLYSSVIPTCKLEIWGISFIFFFMLKLEYRCSNTYGVLMFHFSKDTGYIK